MKFADYAKLEETSIERGDKNIIQKELDGFED